MKLVLGPVLLGMVLLILYGGIAVFYPYSYFRNTYQSMIQDKYDYLVSITEPKIIIVGGSSVAFGLNNKMLSEATGYPVASMGLHGGFGGLFNTEIAKANIGKGDIVLLAYEYEWCTQEAYFEELGVDLVMSGIDSKIEMYRHIPLKNWPEIIGYLPTYYSKKAITPYYEGAYSREGFDENAQMVYERVSCIQNYEENIATLGMVDLSGLNLPDSTVRYLREFKEYCEERGASIYFVAPPLYCEAKKSDDDTFLEMKKKEEEEIGIPYISNPLDYVYPIEYMYDTIYHCSSEGERVRTEQLIQDLREHMLISKE